MIKPLLIEVKGGYITTKAVMPKNGKTFELKELQDMVAGGGLIQMLDAKNGMQIVCDEEAKLKSQEVNIVATMFYIYGDLNPDAWANGVGDQVNGTALLVDPKFLNHERSILNLEH